MFQPACYGGFHKESRTNPVVVGMLVVELLQRDFATEVFIDRDQDLSDAAASVRSDDSKSGARGAESVGLGDDRLVWVYTIFEVDRFRNALQASPQVGIVYIVQTMPN
jgi:hypothetical protein